MKPRLIALLILTLIITGLFPTTVLAASNSYQICSPGSSCIIGEFLYNDSYVPITTATCTITSRNPDDSLLLNSVPMTAKTDGWYTYSVTTPATEGVYRTQVCCTATPDFLCLDKTFQVKAPSSTLTAADVWSYSSRSLSSFGTLVTDVWNYSTRTITGGLATTTNNYITNNNTGTITNNNTGTITNNTTSNIASDQLTNLITITAENRKLIEQLVNKPVVKTYIDEAASTSLQSKIEKTRNLTTRLYTNIQDLKSRAELLDLKWEKLPPEEIRSELETFNKILKEDTFRENTSLLASTDWLKTAWDSTIALNLSDQAQAAQSRLENLINDLTLFGKKGSPIAFKSALSHIKNLDHLLGTSLAGASDTTLFGFLRRVSDLAIAFDKQTEAGNKILDLLADSNTPSDIDGSINSLTGQVLNSNQLPSANFFLENPLKNEKNARKNKVLGLLALIDTNRLFLAGKTGQVVKNIWLVEGSVIFRAVASNPSSTISQKVTVKILLPPEVKREQIIKADPALTIDFDTTENALFATSEIDLAPRETRTFLVEVEDIWTYNDEEIKSLRDQSAKLVTAVKGTSFYSQALSLESDVDVALTKIMLHQKQATTPENRIRTYRESQLEMVGIQEKINGLKQLTNQATASTSIFGFVGGVQAIAVWGLIVVVVGGFIFLAIYMRALRLEVVNSTTPPKSTDSPFEKTAQDIPLHHRHRPTGNRRAHRVTMIVVATLLTTGLGSLLSSVAISSYNKRAPLLSPTGSRPQTLGASTDQTYPQPATLNILPNSNIHARTDPLITAPIAATFKEKLNVFVFRRLNGWAQIGLSKNNQDKVLWVNEHFLK